MQKLIMAKINMTEIIMVKIKMVYILQNLPWLN